MKCKVMKDVFFDRDGYNKIGCAICATILNSRYRKVKEDNERKYTDDGHSFMDNPRSNSPMYADA